MSGPKLNTAASLVPGVNNALMQTYRQDYQGEVEALATVMDLGLPSSLRKELFAMRQTLPYPEVWYYGDMVPEEGTDTLPYDVQNFRYAKEISWYVDDESDNQVGSLRGDAEELGRNFASNDSRAYFDIVNGGADGFVPYVPIAPDGAVLHNATDGGGGDRFGVSGGNIQAVTSTSTDTIVDGLWAAMFRFTQFKNTKGQPFFSGNARNMGYVLYYSAADGPAWTKALHQMLIQGSSAAPSNVVLDTGVDIKPYPTPRLPAGVAVLNRTDAPRKAVFSLLREAIHSVPFTPQNDGLSRRQGKAGVQFIERKGYGVNVPFSSIRLNLSA